MKLLLDRHDPETNNFVASEVETDLLTMEPVECPPTSVPEILYHCMLSKAKMYKKDIMCGNSHADIYLWNEYYLANLGMAKWYRQQVENAQEAILWNLQQSTAQ